MKEDTYPAKGGKSIFTFSNIFKAALIILVCVLWYKSCHPASNPVIPATITTKEQAAIVKADTMEGKRIRDSFAIVLNKYYKRDIDNGNEFARLVNENSQLYMDNQRLLKPNVIDTCKELDAYWNKKYTNYATQSQKTISAGVKTVSGLSQTVASQKKAIESQFSLYQKLKGSMDTCLKYSSINEQTIKKLTPHNKVAFGLVSNIYPVFGYGVGADFISKRGWVISVSGMMMQDKTYGQIGLKRVITFRK